MSRPEDVHEHGPRPLSWSLERVARTIRRVDVVGLGRVTEVWPQVTAARASGATPARVERGTLVVAVPTGAHAARARRDAEAMLEQLGAVLERAPATLRVVVRTPPGG